jgi:putative membrane protein
MDKRAKPAGAPSDHLANERTFLAWIRTSIAMMGFGFVVVKFALFVKQIGLAVHTTQLAPVSKGYSSVIGIFLVATGVLMSIYAYIRYRITEQQLSTGAYKPSYWLAIIVTVLLLMAGMALLFYLIPNI